MVKRQDGTVVGRTWSSENTACSKFRSLHRGKLFGGEIFPYRKIGVSAAAIQNLRVFPGGNLLFDQGPLLWSSPR